ncbi:MAG TPA: LysR family transcriptional regulator [Beijerinckiaceae bacterium]|jgi:DNA-binding transcriptional LysR family regulator
MMPASHRQETRPSRPTVRELEVLRAVIDTRKTTAAASRLGMSQPAISRAIAALEERLGRALFQRDGGRLVPTPEAFALDAEAAPIIAALARLEHWPHPVLAGAQLRIAATPTIAQAFLSPLVIRFMQLEPEVRIQIEIVRHTDAVLAVAEGSADLGVVDVPDLHAGVRAEPFRHSQAHVLLRREHPLARLEVITPAELAGQPLIAVTKRFSSRARIERAFADHGIAPRFVLEASTLLFVADVVRAGLGVAVTNPFPLSRIVGNDLVFRPFAPAIAYETSFLFTSGTRPAVASRFADFVRQEQDSSAV